MCHRGALSFPVIHTFTPLGAVSADDDTRHENSERPCQWWHGVEQAIPVIDPGLYPERFDPGSDKFWEILGSNLGAVRTKMRAWRATSPGAKNLRGKRFLLSRYIAESQRRQKEPKERKGNIPPYFCAVEAKNCLFEAVTACTKVAPSGPDSQVGLSYYLDYEKRISTSGGKRRDHEKQRAGRGMKKEHRGRNDNILLRFMGRLVALARVFFGDPPPPPGGIYVFLVLVDSICAVLVSKPSLELSLN
ncbi:hypothetical protein C8R45DRAFT_935930 [Mycena sanguinolenta]|nr:hypothetical protein C8R45DRAFT_935930 [Mycena sanguinolenta]